MDPGTPHTHANLDHNATVRGNGAWARSHTCTCKDDGINNFFVPLVESTTHCVFIVPQVSCSLGVWFPYFSGQI